MAAKRFYIQQTKDYDKFVRSDANRVTNLKKHKKLEESMGKYGFLPYWPIVVRENGNGTFYIEDGQHRHVFARQLELPVFYVVAQDDFNIAEVNNTQKVWHPVDYAEMYAAQGLKDYAGGLEFMHTYGLAVGAAFALLAGTTTFSNIDDAFRRGEFKIKDREWANSVAGLYTQIVALSSDVKNTRFLEACMAVCRVDRFDPRRMIQGAKRCRDKLANYTTRDAYLSLCEELYSFGRKQLVPLKIEAAMAMRERNAVTQAKKKRSK